MKISVAIITFNEERNIDRCLQSVQKVADEIIVVDSFSTDKTEEICNSFGVKFIKEKFRGHIQQKNFAIQQTSYEWVLSLDADEALSEKLIISILEIKNQPEAEAYWLNRLTNYCGQWIYHCGWYPDRKIRLFNKNIAEWGGLNPHDKIVLKTPAKVGTLQGDLLHYSFYTINEHNQQIEKFSTIAAQAAFNEGKRSNLFKIISNPFFTFFRKYLLQLGFLDGYFGFVITINSSYANFLKYTKLKALQDQKREPN